MQLHDETGRRREDVRAEIGARRRVDALDTGSRCIGEGGGHRAIGMMPQLGHARMLRGDGVGQRRDADATADCRRLKRGHAVVDGEKRPGDRSDSENERQDKPGDGVQPKHLSPSGQNETVRLWMVPWPATGLPALAAAKGTDTSPGRSTPSS